MDDEADRCHFQEVFSQVSLAHSIKLLPWCISSTVPLYYMSGTIATAMQQDEDIPAASEPEGSLAPGPSSSPAHPPRTPPLQVPPLLDIPFVGTPWWDAHMLISLPSPHRKSKTTLPVVHSTIITTRGPALTPKRSKHGENTALHRGMRTCLN